VEIVVCVHVATEEGSPGAGGLWRWAVHVGRDFSDPLSCLIAGAADDQVEAMIRGQETAVACARVAERCGQLEFTGEATTVVLDHDPCDHAWPLLRFEEDY
jgi:hypothetical protein